MSQPPLRILPSSQHTPNAGDGVAAAAALARVASSSDRPQDLIDRAAAQLGRPLGLAGPHGEPLAASAHDGLGAAALEIACSAADGPAALPLGWSVIEIQRLGHLAVGPSGPSASGSPALVDLLRSLLAAQLQRTRLRDRERAARRGTFVRCLVRDPVLDSARAGREAATLGFQLADAYRVALLVWADRAGGPEALRCVQIESARRDPGCLSLPIEGHLLLLHPRREDADDGWLAALEGLVAFARRSTPGVVQALAGQGTMALAELPAAAEDLLGLGRVMEAPSDGDRFVVRAEQFGLDRLLRRGLEARAAAAFVDMQLGAVIAWDDRHGDDLLGVLEAALDWPQQGEAARRCYMHRNTFRHHLRRASELLGDPLEDPRRRLALHVALKLRRLQAPPPDSDRRTNGTNGRGMSSSFGIARPGTLTARGATTSPTVGSSSSS